MILKLEILSKDSNDDSQEVNLVLVFYLLHLIISPEKSSVLIAQLTLRYRDNVKNEISNIFITC